jgi:hypothetical protein
MLFLITLIRFLVRRGVIPLCRDPSQRPLRLHQMPFIVATWSVLAPTESPKSSRRPTPPRAVGHAPLPSSRQHCALQPLQSSVSPMSWQIARYACRPERVVRAGSCVRRRVPVFWPHAGLYSVDHQVFSSVRGWLSSLISFFWPDSFR